MHSKKGLDLHVVFFINTSYYASEHVHVQCTVSIPYPFAGHLRLHRLQEVSEPLKRTWLWADPVEIDLPQFKCGVLLGELVEDRLENWSKRSHPNTSPHEQSNFVRKHILTSRPEWSIHRYTVQNKSPYTWHCIYTKGDGWLWYAWRNVLHNTCSNSRG